MRKHLTRREILPHDYEELTVFSNPEKNIKENKLIFIFVLLVRSSIDVHFQAT